MPETQPVSRKKIEAPPDFFPEAEKFGQKEAREAIPEKDLLAGLLSSEKDLAKKYHAQYPEINPVLMDPARRKEFLKTLSTIDKLPGGKEFSLLDLFNRYGIISSDLRSEAENKDKSSSQEEIEDIWGSIKEREFRSQSALEWESRNPPSMPQ